MRRSNSSKWVEGNSIFGPDGRGLRGAVIGTVVAGAVIGTAETDDVAGSGALME
jgi:hypothetical protein